MTPENPTVTPNDPGKDTKVVYYVVEQSVKSIPKVPKSSDVTPVNSSQHSGEEEAKVSKITENKAVELPQTGDKQDNTLVTIGTFIVAGLLGIIGFGRKKDDKKEI